MHVVAVAGDHHVVPLVVVERLVRVSLHERRPVAQIEDVMDVPVEQCRGLHTLLFLPPQPSSSLTACRSPAAV